MDKLYCCTADEFVRFVREGYIAIDATRKMQIKDINSDNLPKKDIQKYLKKLPITDSSKSVVLIKYVKEPGLLKYINRKVIVKDNAKSFYVLSESAQRVLQSIIPSVNFEVAAFFSGEFSREYDSNIRLQSSVLGANYLISSLVGHDKVAKMIEANIMADAKHYHDLTSQDLGIQEQLEKSIYSLPCYSLIATYEYLKETCGPQLPKGELAYIFLPALVFHNTGIKVTDTDVRLSSAFTEDMRRELANKDFHECWNYIFERNSDLISMFDLAARSKSTTPCGLLLTSCLLRLCDNEIDFDKAFINRDALIKNYSSYYLMNAVLPALWFFGFKSGYPAVRDMVEQIDGDTGSLQNCLNDAAVEKISEYLADPKSRAESEKVLNQVKENPKLSKEKLAKVLDLPPSVIGRILKASKLTKVSDRERFASDKLGISE